MNQNKWKHFVILPENDGKKLLKFLKEIFVSYPLSLLYRLIRNKDIKINGARTKDDKLVLKSGDVVEIFFAREIENNQNDEFKEAKPTFDVIYEDENILIVDKPVGISIHSEANCLDFQVLNYLKFKNIPGNFRPSHIGRIDKETSGIVLYAKSHSNLVQLNAKTKYFDKAYVFESDFESNNDIVCIDIVQNGEKRDALINPDSPICTKFTNLNNKKFAYILTGKKHQIRLTLKALNTPIYGDKKYGGKSAKRMYLHSHQLTFHNLHDNLVYLNEKTFESKVPWEFKKESDVKNW
ncbi:pseudouridine synthase [Mycoplasmopsis columbinasalis]|uniref:RNA pseudouridylate synthase n=1 Tax=Mycoplasmopsis columbinasalis TaxID=114880 RepID=A0A449BAT0_9BACT|nr:RluA family pseudouridine synthase [Mycoplasmopsis columbinasalis]VEU78137.1 Pseudouridylate synthase [Mycoplasmopsis columbinasalis]